MDKTTASSGTDNGMKNEIQLLQQQMKEMQKKKLNELTEKVERHKTDSKELRSTHPPVIFKKESYYDTWKLIIENDLSYLNEEREIPFEMFEDKKIKKSGYVITYLFTRVYDEHKQLISKVVSSLEILKKLEKVKYEVWY